MKTELRKCLACGKGKFIGKLSSLSLKALGKDISFFTLREKT